jgi:diguanylate cyclase (GGDEF)-like protein/PAS domain S-box-containing protein
MWGTISPGEASALYRLVADSPTDLVLRTDRAGRIVHATPATEELGLSFPQDPIGCHLLDFLHPSCGEAVLAEHAAAVAGRDGCNWLEVRALLRDGGHRWMELKLGALPQRSGALGLLRSIEDRRALEDRLFVAAMTDPLTRLTNREAFVRMLGHLVDSGARGHIALFDLDHFRTINLQHGHSGGDRVLVAFARLLQGLLRADDILSRIGGGTFGVLLPDVDAADAHAACSRVVAAMAELNDGAGTQRLTASAGVARFAISADATLREAELALISAKSRGRNRVERSRRWH